MHFWQHKVSKPVCPHGNTPGDHLRCTLPPIWEVIGCHHNFNFPRKA